MSWRKLIIIAISIVIIIYISIEIYSINLVNKGKKLLDSIDKDFKIEDEKFISIPKYYVNLDRSIERRNRLETEFKKYNIVNYTRIKAFDKYNLKDIEKGEVNNIKYINDYGGEKHELGCTLSHLIAIKTAYRNGDEMALIFEDDINFNLYPLWRKSFTEIIKDLPKNIEILQLISNKNIETINFDIIKRPNNLATHGCTGAYLINRKGMKKVIDNFFLEDNTVKFKKELKLDNIRADYGFYNFMNVYYINCNLFLMYNFEYENNSNGRRNILRFIERDYQTLKYLTDNK